MRDKLIGIGGLLGFGLLYAFSILFFIAPLVFLDFPWWATFLIIAVLLGLKGIGDILAFVLYVWAFIVVIKEPIDALSVAFFVMAGLFILFAVLPFISSVISAIVSTSRGSYNNPAKALLFGNKPKKKFRGSDAGTSPYMNYDSLKIEADMSGLTVPQYVEYLRLKNKNQQNSKL